MISSPVLVRAVGEGTAEYFSEGPGSIGKPASTWSYYGLYGEVHLATECGGSGISCEGGPGTGNALPGE